MAHYILYIYFQEEMGRVRHDFENILEEKLALDTEIAVYRGLIEAEERRLAKYCLLDTTPSTRDNARDI